MLTLSRFSEYRLRDWLKLFRFDIELIPQLQLLLPFRNTILLESSLADPQRPVTWLRDRFPQDVRSSLAPFSALFEAVGPLPLESLQKQDHHGFLYAKVGEEDDLAFPELLPGGLVRVRRSVNVAEIPITDGRVSKRPFLVEHSGGVCFGYLRRITPMGFRLVSGHLPSAELEFKIPDQARILGAPDMEFRSLQEPRLPRLGRQFTCGWVPKTLAPRPATLNALLKIARPRMDLSFREASTFSQQIADATGDHEYFLSPGALSDYESQPLPPRHFQKLISICAIYGLELDSVLGALNCGFDQGGRDVLPHRFIGYTKSVVEIQKTESVAHPSESGILAEFLTRATEIPFFLTGSLSELFGFQSPSLRDIFWMKPKQNVIHPYLSGGLVVLVNRRKKRLDHCNAVPVWQQSLGVIRLRDGTYLCGCIETRDQVLNVHSYADGRHETETISRQDTDVVGQVVAIVRLLQ
jgi:hypothetical protein